MLEIRGIWGADCFVLAALLSVVDAHRPSEQVDGPSVDQAQLAHLFLDAALRWIVLQRFEDVSVRWSLSANEETKQRDKQFKITEVEAAPELIFRFAEVEHQQPSARPRHTLHFTQASFPARQISQSVADRHNVE